MKKLTLALCVLIGSNAYAGEAANESAAAMKGDAEAGKGKSAICAACHTADGNSPAPAPGAPESLIYPKIAGQHENYLYKQLVAFKSGKRQNATMAGMVAALNEQDMMDLSTYFSSQKMSPGAASEDLVKAGQAIYRGGIKNKKIPACIACHGPSGLGMPAANYPRLGGQHAAYIETQLKRFKAGNHAGDAHGNMMQDIAARLSDKETKAVASYINGLH